MKTFLARNTHTAMVKIHVPTVPPSTQMGVWKSVMSEPARPKPNRIQTATTATSATTVAFASLVACSSFSL